MICHKRVLCNPPSTFRTPYLDASLPWYAHEGADIYNHAIVIFIIKRKKENPPREIFVTACHEKNGHPSTPTPLHTF